MARLGDYVRIRTGKLDANVSDENGQYPFFTCAVEPLRISSYSYDCECVLVAGNGDLNVKYYNGKFDAYQRTYIIESLNKTVLSVPYLYCFLDKYVETLREQAIGGVIKYIKLGNLTEAQIPIPSIEAQIEVVEKLNIVNRLLALRKDQIAKLDQLVKSRFVEMFGDMLLNPMGWPEKRLDSMAQIVSGVTKGRKIKDTELFEVPYMAVSNVKDGYIDWTIVKTIMATQAEINQYKLQPFDVLMTEGGDPDKLGRGAIIHEPPKNCIHQNHIFRVRLNKEVLLPEYMEQYLQQQRAKRYFLGCAKQTTGIASINMKQLTSLPVLVPPMTLQTEFSAFIAQVDKSKLAIQKSLDKLEMLKKALMQKYFG